VAEDRRLSRLTKICLALPETERTLSEPHAGFRVGGRTFAYYLDDHRGNEGIVGVVCKAHGGENEALAVAHPERYYIPAYLGPKGWLGLRLDTPQSALDEVAERVTESYALVAPKRLAAQLG
jgi:hypothetical protein